MADDDKDLTPKERTAEFLAPWIAVVFSALAAIGGLWTAWETRTLAQATRETAVLDARSALVRSCDVFSAARFRDGDDMMVLKGAAGGDRDYLSTIERADFDQQRANGKAKNFLRCEFTNYSRVPLLTVIVYMGVDYHHHREHKIEHNFPFSALGPEKSRALWIFNDSNEAVAVSTPQRAQYARFPDLGTFQQQQFRPALSDYWVLKRDEDPAESLDQSMM